MMRVIQRTTVTALVVGSTGLACSDPIVRPQLVVVVDTDVAVPRWVDHLFVEVFSRDMKTRIDARDHALLNSSDWPLSFGVRAEAETSRRSVVMRLRAYSAARQGAPQAAPPAKDELDEVDHTTLIDRIVIAELPTQGLRTLDVVLTGDCMARPASLEAGLTCVDGSRLLVPVPTERSTTDTASHASVTGTWPRVATACNVALRSATQGEEVCVPGGAFVMGNALFEGILPQGEFAGEYPERVVQISPFVMDRYEVSVARYRAALSAPMPFVPPVGPTLREGAPSCADASVNFRFCTWTGDASPADTKADELPLNCVPFETARAFCQWAGGDLPTEAQWEYAAAQAFRTTRTSLPWAGEPNCGASSFGRFLNQQGECGGCGLLPAVAPFAGGSQGFCTAGGCERDETPAGPDGRGLVGLGGNVAEWVRDVRGTLRSPCWYTQGPIDPVCEETGAAEHMFRGGSWLLGAYLMDTAVRSGGLEENPLLWQYGAVGFRCVRQGRSE